MKLPEGWGLKLRDFLKGAIMAIGTPVLYMLQELIPDYPLNPIEKAAASALVTYLIKNFFTNDTKVAIKVLKADADKRDKQI